MQGLNLEGEGGHKPEKRKKKRLGQVKSKRESERSQESRVKKRRKGAGGQRGTGRYKRKRV